MLEPELRVDDDRWEGLSVMDSDKVHLIAAAFASNRVFGETFAEDDEPVDDKEKSETARQSMRNLINGEASASRGRDTRLGRASIAGARAPMDAAFDARLREIVRETVQEMFGTETGQKLSSGIRRMVRREIEMMIALERAS